MSRGVYVRGVSVQEGICPGVSVRGVHVQGGYVLEPWCLDDGGSIRKKDRVSTYMKTYHSPQRI